MSKAALSKLGSLGSLNAAWLHLFKNTRPASRNTQGIDGQSINDFALDVKANLNRLSKEFPNGSFKFNKLRPVLIQKPNGKFRLICVPTVKDRIVQRALLDVLSIKYGNQLANSVSFGFLKNRGVRDAVKVACARRKLHPWIFKTDITSFFDQVDRQQLAKAIQKTVREKSLHPLLINASNCEVQYANKRDVARISKLGIREGLGVRQGMPLSPFFANLLLLPFDRIIVKNGIEAVRYADDLIFFADSEAECHELASFCSTELSKLALKIPDIGPGSKSEIFRPSQAAEFLGLGLSPSNNGYELKIMPSQIAGIKSEILQLGSIEELLARKITLAKLGLAIVSRKMGYLNAYEACTNIVELENALDSLHQKILRLIYKNLNINLASLNATQRTFLGLL